MHKNLQNIIALGVKKLFLLNFHFTQVLAYERVNVER